MKSDKYISLVGLLVPVVGFAQLSFEPYEGYSVGPLVSEVLSINAGAAEISNLRMADGIQSVWMKPTAEGDLGLTWDYDTPESGISYVSLALEIPQSVDGAVYEIVSGGAFLKLTEAGGELGISVYDVTAEGAEGEPGQAYEVYTKELGGGLNWSYLTIRYDHHAGYFDCYVGGEMIAADIPLAEGNLSMVLQSSDGGQLYLDRLAHLARPLDFEDADLDGLPDDWESLHGLSLAINDRYSDLNGDGENNLFELGPTDIQLSHIIAHAR